jgi:phosphoglycerate dehydrogenase-like enzyme
MVGIIGYGRFGELAVEAAAQFGSNQIGDV